MNFTKEQLEDFRKFVDVQDSGRYNMLMDGLRAMLAAGIPSRERYLFVLNNYDELEIAAKKVLK